MKRYRSPRRRWIRRIFILAVISIVVAVSLSIHYNITSVVLSVAQTELSARAQTAFREAVYETLSSGNRYENLVAVSKDSEGNIVALTANAFEINRIAHDACLLSQEKIKESGAQGVEIPLGAFFGFEAWSGVGPRVIVPVLSVATVTGKFSSKFVGAGINQTKHSIYLEITAEIALISAGNRRDITAYGEVLVAESVLVGKVPSTYLSGGLFGSNASISQ